MSLSFIGPCNHTGIGHHATAIACALNAVTDLDYHPIYVDPTFRNHVLQKHNLKIASALDPAAPTFIFDSSWVTTWHNSGSGRILLLPFETTNPIPVPEFVFHNVSAVGTFGSWGLEILKGYLPEDRLFQIPYAMLLNGKGLFTDVFDAKPNPEILQRIVGVEPAELTFSMMAKAELRKCVDLILSQMPALGERHDIFWFGTDAGVGLRAHSIFEIAKKRWNYKILPPHTDKYHGIMERGDTRIFVIKLLSDEQLWKVASAPRYFLAFSRGEGWGIPAYEAITLGMKVIGSEVGNQAEFLNERTAVAARPDAMIKAVDSWTGFRYPGQNPQYFNHVSILPTVRRGIELPEESWNRKVETAKMEARSYDWIDVAKRLVDISTKVGGGLDDLYRRSWYS